MNIDKLNFDNPINFSRRDVRDALGLAPRFREYAWPAFGMLSAGLVIGAGTALLLAPKSGKKLRAQISDEVRTRLEAVEARVRELTNKAKAEMDGEIEVESKAA